MLWYVTSSLLPSLACVVLWLPIMFIYSFCWCGQLHCRHCNKYSIFPHNCNIEASLKVYSLSGSQDNEEELIEYGTFSQKGEWEEGQYPVGDVNGDYIVNVLDVVRLATMVIETAQNVSPEEEQRADINEDGSINVQDIIILVNMIIG